MKIEKRIIHEDGSGDVLTVAMGDEVLIVSATDDVYLTAADALDLARALEEFASDLAADLAT